MRRIPRLYVLFFILVISAWLVFMVTNSYFGVYQTHWKSALTMVFGSFIAGATSEGGGAVAFPVFTLILQLPSAVARNFSFAIQSIGMTAATLLIFSMKIPIDKKAIKLTTLSGIPGLFFGMYCVAPFISSGFTKLFFVSLWLSFAMVLFIVNKKSERNLKSGLGTLFNNDIFLILSFGFIGGVITSIFGDGINIFTFCLFTLFYNVNEKIATPTSVVIMTIHTIIGFLSHVFIFQDFSKEAFNYWICAVPVAVIMAPLGAFIISFLTRKFVLNFFYIVSFIQYIGAVFVLKPEWPKLILSFVILLTGFMLFKILNTQGYRKNLAAS